MFYLIWKPLGITSFQAINILKAHLGIKKIGHTGTLDPLATGLLLAATDKDTKRISECEGQDKIYEYEVRLDGSSPTDDAEGPITPSPTWEGCSEGFTIENIQSLIDANLLGDIEQTPTKYSALKINGKRAYELARSNANFQMPTRTTTIHSHQVLNLTPPSIHLRCHVSKGTYVRTLSSDLCKLLDCDGFVNTLTRTGIGDISYTYNEANDWNTTPITSPKRILRYDQEGVSEAVLRWKEVNI